MLFQIFFHHKLMIIVFIDQSFLIYWHLNEGNFKSNYSPMERYLYRKSNQNIIFFNAWILPTCSFTVTVYFNLGLLVFLCMLDCCIFMYRICWIAGIFTCQIAGIFRYVRPYDSESGWTICSSAAKCAGYNYRDSRGEARVWQITGKFVMTAKHYPARS